MAGLLKTRIKALFGVLVAVIAAHILLLVFLEQLSLADSAWMTFTTLTTVGFGDVVPETNAGRVATVLILYLLGIALLTLIVSDFVEYRFYRRERILTGRWKYSMKDHIVVINKPRRGGERYFHRIAQQLREIPSYEKIPIQILTLEYDDGLSAELRDAGIRHYHGSGTDGEALKAVHADQARHILLLAPDEVDPLSDSLTFDVAHRLSELGLGGKVTVECVRDENRTRFKKLGIRTVIRPVRTYPEIIVRAVVLPGSEKVLEDLFSYQRDHPERYDIETQDVRWSDVVSNLIKADIGTALAYINDRDEVVCHPPPGETISSKGLIVLVKSEQVPPVVQVRAALNKLN